MNVFQTMPASTCSRRSLQAFTLVEVLVAAAVLTIMSAVVLQSFSVIYRRAVDKRTTSNAYAILQSQIESALNDPYTITQIPASLTTSSTTVQIYPNPTTTGNTYYLAAANNKFVMGTLQTNITSISSGANGALGLLQIDVLITCTNADGYAQTFEMRTVRGPDL